MEMPYWIRDLGIFIENRKAPKQRENIETLLKMSGCDTLLGWLEVTHVLTLIDTYWVKPKQSALDWKKVGLYTHKFNEVVAKTALEGGLHGRCKGITLSRNTKKVAKVARFYLSKTP